MTSSVPATPPPRLSDAVWLTRPETKAVFAALEGGGHEARIVGGAVRNTLLSLPVTDLDFATTARPEEVMSLARAAGLGVVPTGIEHGTVTVITSGKPFEVTTLRQDVETDGRRATVRFTADWAADARRRDFTLNALYVDRAGTIFDPVGGYPDLLARRIRFIGEPAERIREDYLRVLRFFRFNAQYGSWPLDHASLMACVGGRGGLAHLSGERVRQELLKLLAGPHAVRSVEAMFEHGLLTEFIPAAPRIGEFVRLTGIEAALDRRPDPILRLASLTIAVPEDAERLSVRLRLSNTERTVLQRAAAVDLRLSPRLTAQDARALVYRLGAEAWSTHVLLAWARANAAAQDQGWRELLELPHRDPPLQFPLRGADVLALGQAPGPRVGEILAALEAWWIDAGFPPDGPELRKRLAEIASPERDRS